MQATSQIANTIAKESGLKGQHYAKILDALKAIGSGTAYEIAAKCGMDAVQVSRRLSEMPSVYDTGRKGRTPSNRPAIKWAAVTSTNQTQLFN